MSLTKEIINQEKSRMQSGITCELHLWREGAFLRAYDWSAWLCCHFLHDFKVNKRQFKDDRRAAVLPGGTADQVAGRSGSVNAR